MKYSEVKMMILRTFAVALVLVMPWAGALAADVASWSELQQQLGGWGGSVTLTADIVAEGTINVSEYDSKTVVLNDYILTPPSGSASVFSLAAMQTSSMSSMTRRSLFMLRPIRAARRSSWRATLS